MVLFEVALCLVMHFSCFLMRWRLSLRQVLFEIVADCCVVQLWLDMVIYRVFV